LRNILNCNSNPNWKRVVNKDPNLSSLRKGQRATITGIHAPDGLRQRLQAMGLRAGRQAEVIRRSRLGGPMQVRVGNVNLIMRRRDAARVFISTTQ
jgi:ferrous iron transport protein A